MIKMKEEIYVTQPEGFVKKTKVECMLKLNKALYGLKQVPIAWNEKLNDTLRSIEFLKRKNRPRCVLLEFFS